MKLNELRELIRNSTLQQKKINDGIYHSVEQYFEAKDELMNTRKIINKLNREGKLDIDIDILSDNIKKYFKDKGALDAELVCTQYTDQKDIYPYFDDKRPVLNANASGLIKLSVKRGLGTAQYVYPLFDVKADLSEVANIQMFDDNRMVVTKFTKINVLDLVPSYKNCFMERNSELIKKYPRIIDVVFDSLGQTQQRKLNADHSINISK